MIFVPISKTPSAWTRNQCTNQTAVVAGKYSCCYGTVCMVLPPDATHETRLLCMLGTNFSPASNHCSESCSSRNCFLSMIYTCWEHVRVAREGCLRFANHLGCHRKKTRRQAEIFCRLSLLHGPLGLGYWTYSSLGDWRFPSLSPWFDVVRRTWSLIFGLKKTKLAEIFARIRRVTVFHIARVSFDTIETYLGLVHTMPDKFENATLRAKTEQMFCVHTWKRIKCSASTLQRFRWLFTFKIWQFEL